MPFSAAKTSLHQPLQAEPTKNEWSQRGGTTNTGGVCRVNNMAIPDARHADIDALDGEGRRLEAKEQLGRLRMASRAGEGFDATSFDGRARDTRCLRGACCAPDNTDARLLGRLREPLATGPDEGTLVAERQPSHSSMGEACKLENTAALAHKLLHTTTH